MADDKIQNSNNILLEKYKSYHYNAYRNLVVTLVSLNSAGIGASLAFMSVISADRCKVVTTLSTNCNTLELSLCLFAVGLFFILTEIYIEYFTYFLFVKFIKKHNINNSEANEICFKDLFMIGQIMLLILSGISLLLGGYKLMQI